MSDDLGSRPASPSVPSGDGPTIVRMSEAMAAVYDEYAPEHYAPIARAALLAIRGSEHALWSSGRCWVSGRGYGQYGDNKHYVYIQEPGKETRLIATFASRAKAEYMAARLNGFNERIDAILNGDA